MNGIYCYPPEKPDQLLAWIEVHESDSKEIVYAPTARDLEDISIRHDFDHLTLMQAIENKRSNVSAFIIDAPVFRLYLRGTPK